MGNQASVSVDPLLTYGTGSSSISYPSESSSSSGNVETVAAPSSGTVAISATSGQHSGEHAKAGRGLMITCYGVLIVQWTLMTVLFAFFPTANVTFGISSTLKGLILSSLPFGSAVIAPFISKFIFVLQPRGTMIAGILAMPVFLLLFGLSPMLGLDTNTEAGAFITFGFLYGAGSTLAEGASYALLATSYPENVGKVLAGAEIAAGCGAMLGPFVGGLAFDGAEKAGASSNLQFLVPFLCTAPLPLLLLLPAWQTVPHSASINSNSKVAVSVSVSVWSLLTPMVVLDGAAVVLAAVMFGTLNATLATQMKILYAPGR